MHSKNDNVKRKKKTGIKKGFVYRRLHGVEHLWQEKETYLIHEVKDNTISLYN